MTKYDRRATDELSSARSKGALLGRVASADESKSVRPAAPTSRLGSLRRMASWTGKYTTFAFLFTLIMLLTPAISQARWGVVITIAPAPLPVYEQPFCPGPGYIWTPGYWACGPGGYFWVPGTWVLAPFPGALWTPGYWAWDADDGTYFWNEGYWGPVVGFYGGIYYGYGYTGYGYEGGYWRNGGFYYNRAVNHVNTTNITNVYNKTVINNVTVNNVSYNGGNGGTAARPTGAELAAAHGRREPPTPEQRKHVEVARADPTQFASRNHGRPPVAATPQPGAMRGPGVVRASRAGSPPSKQEAQPQPAGKFRPFSRSNPSESEKPVTSANPVTPERGRPGNKPEQPAGKFRPFSRSNPRESEKPVTSANPVTPERGRPGNKPERPTRMESSAPQRGPASREANRPAPRPEKPAKEKPNKKDDKHEPPRNNGLSHFSLDRPNPGSRTSASSGTSPIVRNATPPERTSPHAAASQGRSLAARPQSITVHATTKDRTERHPNGGGR